MALNQPTHRAQHDFAWKRQERSDLLAALLSVTNPVLKEEALDAYNEGWPAPLVAWAAQRAWAQSQPDTFRAILRNHALDAFAKLTEMLSGT